MDASESKAMNPIENHKWKMSGIKSGQNTDMTAFSTTFLEI